MKSSFHVGFGLLYSTIWLWYWNDPQGTFLGYIVLKLQRSKEAIDLMCLQSFPSSRSLSSERVCLRNGQQSFNLLPRLWGTSGISRANRLGPCLSGHSHRALSKWTLSPHTVLLAWAWASRQEEFSQFACPWSFSGNLLFSMSHHCHTDLFGQKLKFFQNCVRVHSEFLTPKKKIWSEITFFRWQTWPCAPCRPGGISFSLHFKHFTKLFN